MRVRVLIDWLVHDGVLRQRGEVLDLPRAAAEALIAVGAAEEVPSEPVEVEVPREQLQPAQPGGRRRRG